MRWRHINDLALVEQMSMTGTLRVAIWWRGFGYFWNLWRYWQCCFQVLPGLNLFARFSFFPTHCCRVDTVHWILSTLFLPHISHPANATIDFSTTSVLCPFPRHQIIAYSVILTNHCSLESLTFVIVTKLLTVPEVQDLSIDFFH